MRIVASITHCKTCGGPISVRDVFKSRSVRNMSDHVVIAYSCPNCTYTDRLIAYREAWNRVALEHDIEERDIQDQIKSFRLELSMIDNVDDLLQYWASLRQPPRVEATRGACDCYDCERKWYL